MTELKKPELFTENFSDHTQVAAGHLDWILKVNHGEEILKKDNMLAVQFVFLNANKHDGRKLNTWISVTKKNKQLDWKIQFTFDQSGPSSNVLAIVRYAKDKTISVSLYVSMPSISHTHIESKLNVTIPSFSPMILEAKILEALTNEYDVSNQL